MAGKQRKYDREYKIQAVKLSKEIGGVRVGDLGGHYGWQMREGRWRRERGIRTPKGP